MLKHMIALITSSALALSNVLPATAADAKFGPSNPFYGPSTLPFQAPPFDKIKDEDYQPAIEAGMAEQLVEIQAIADNPAPPTFENTLVAMQKSGQLLRRATAVFGAVSQANTNPVLQAVQEAESPKLAAQYDAIYLNAKFFARVDALYKQRASLKLDPESLHLLELTYDRFIRSGANLSDADKAELKKLNQQISTLSTAFSSKLLAATTDGAYSTMDKNALAGLSRKAMFSRCRTRRSSLTWPRSA
jgi:peptidyl-dipeptidase Dcp